MFDPETHHRRSIRLRGYDYSGPGTYYVTICTHGKQHLFGEVVDGEMCRSELGEKVDSHWRDLPRHYPEARLDAFVLMPNHIHGLIEIVRAGFKTRPRDLSEIVRGFKTWSARRINEFRRTPGTRVWQRNYYEHIVRDPHELAVIHEYISTNALRWAQDPEFR